MVTAPIIVDAPVAQSWFIRTVPPRTEEAVYELPSDVADMAAVRGSVFVLDWGWLRDNVMFDRYADALGESRSLLDATSGEWIEMDRALEHYRALDSLGFTTNEAAEVGRTVGPRVHGAVLRTLVRLAGTLGVGPWAAVRQAPKLWDRSFRGGAIAAFKTGERSGRLALRQTRLAGSKFFRASIGGVTLAGLEPFCKRAIVQEIREARTPTSFDLRISWNDGAA